MHMADAKALFTQRFDAARTALTEGDEPAAAQSLHSAIVAARSDPSLRRELAVALFQLGKLSRKFGRAGEAEAEPLLSEALSISEEVFGKEDAALAPVLSELGRLYIHRSQHARAEDVLERLLAIARGTGEENADVATALAGLAVVKRKLGDEASAEALFRDALRIREQVLEPSHMVIVVTLEHLSETCAARGNFAEALALLRRGLATRELVLGPGHATVQAARSRVAELELQAAVAADTAAATAAGAAIASLKRVPDSPGDPPSTAVPSPINSTKPDFVGEPKLRLLRPPAFSRERAKTPTVTAAVAAASLMASSIRTPSASQLVVSRDIAPPSESVASRESSAPHRDPVLAHVSHSDVASDLAALGERRSIAPVQADSTEPARKKRTVLYLSAGVAAVAIAIAGLLLSRPRTGGGSDPVPTKTSAAQRTAAAVAPVVPAPRTRSAATGAAAVAAVTRSESLPSASATPASNAPVAKPEQQTATESAPIRLPRVAVHLAPINTPSIPVASLPVPSTPAASRVDSIARPAPALQRASDTDRTGTAEKAPPPTPPSAEVNIAVTPAKIIGRVPEPRFPDALLRAGRRDGQVVMRFVVNEFGSVDVTSVIVERSDDELFTEAVRDILPRFRFEPARTRAPESKPVASWVSVPFRFTTKR
jgi:TonB family protein